MFIGGARDRPAGGIKVTTFSVLLIAIVSTIRGDLGDRAWSPHPPRGHLPRLSVALLSIALVFIVVLART